MLKLTTRFSLSTYPDARALASCLEAGKAEDICLLDVRGKTSIADYFLIASGTSSRHLQALCHRASDFLQATYALHSAQEGRGEATWIVLDASDIIIHLFTAETRAAYDLERMWEEI